MNKLSRNSCQRLLFQENVPNRRQIGYVEQVGTYDPMTNAHNEKLIALNLERIQTYLAGGVKVSCCVMCHVSRCCLCKFYFVSFEKSVSHAKCTLFTF